MNGQPHSNVVIGYVKAYGLAQLLFWSAFYYLLPALSAQITLETNWPVLHISTTYTLAFLLWAVCAPLVGYWIDAGHGRGVMRGGAIAGIALMIAISQTSNKMVFSALVIALGACMAATLYDPCFAIMMRRLKKAGPNAVASVTLVAGFATSLTFPLVFALDTVISWQSIVLAFAVLAAIGVMLLPAEFEAKFEMTQAEQHNPSTIALGKGPSLIAVSFGFVMMGHVILLFLLPVALSRVGNNTNIALLALAILGPAQIAGRIAWLYCGAAFSLQNCAMAMFACLCLPSILLLLFGATTGVVYIALIIQGACYGVHTILRPSLAQRYLPAPHLGRGLGTIAMIGLLMMAIGPAIGGFVWTAAGLNGLMAVVLALNILALLLGALLRTVAPMEAAH